jgi:signal transduction histidine kinase
VTSVQRQVGRLAALTNSVLDLTRIRSARLRLELESCDLVEVVRDVCGRFEDGLRDDGRVLTVSTPHPLPGRWDRTRLEQLLSNLVGNAVKHGGRGDITVTAEARGATAVVTVADTGPGIPEPEQARVFDAFAQGSRAASGGLGLGLYIARSIAGAHGGRISLASTPGRGTSFRIELPVETGVETASLTPAPAAG